MMTGNDHEKKNEPGSEPPFVEEQGAPVKADPTKEQDMDELSHSNLAETPNVNEEIDADDIVHKTHPDTPPAPDTEKDPDDLVHGN